jgi:hypothetical protein
VPDSRIPDEQTETPVPAVTRVLHALTADLHESLCNCKAYPDSCVSKAGYRRDELVWTFGYADAALEEALKQGWTPPAVAGVIPVPAAVESAVQVGIGTIDWDAYPDPPTGGQPAAEAADEAIRAAIAAYLPHQTAEIEQLRAGLASCTYLMPHGHEDAQTCDEPCKPSTDRCSAHDPRQIEYIDGLTGEISRLRAERDALAARDAAWKAHVTHLESRLFDIWILAERPARKCNDLQHDDVCTVAELADSPTWTAVLADPAPSTPGTQENQA